MGKLCGNIFGSTMALDTIETTQTPHHEIMQKRLPHSPRVFGSRALPRRAAVRLCPPSSPPRPVLFGAAVARGGSLARLVGGAAFACRVRSARSVGCGGGMVFPLRSIPAPHKNVTPPAPVPPLSGGRLFVLGACSVSASGGGALVRRRC